MFLSSWLSVKKQRKEFFFWFELEFSGGSVPWTVVWMWCSSSHSTVLVLGSCWTFPWLKLWNQNIVRSSGESFLSRSDSPGGQVLTYWPNQTGAHVGSHTRSTQVRPSPGVTPWHPLIQGTWFFKLTFNTSGQTCRRRFGQFVVLMRHV